MSDSPRTLREIEPVAWGFLKKIVLSELAFVFIQLSPSSINYYLVQNNEE